MNKAIDSFLIPKNSPFIHLSNDINNFSNDIEHINSLLKNHDIPEIHLNNKGIFSSLYKSNKNPEETFIKLNQAMYDAIILISKIEHEIKTHELTQKSEKRKHRLLIEKQKDA